MAWHTIAPGLPEASGTGGGWADGSALRQLRERDYAATRLAFTHAERDELMACLRHLLDQAGNARLMTPELMQTLCDHAAGNFRILTPWPPNSSPSLPSRSVAVTAMLHRLVDWLACELLRQKPRKP